MSLSPAVILYDSAGVAMAVSNGVAIPVGTKALLVAGSDGTDARFIRTAADGTVRIDPTGSSVQPVSDGGGSITVDATSLPLPTGASTSANQTTLGSQTTKLNDGTNTASVKAASTAAVATDQALVVAVSPNNTVPVSAASLPLPTGAATSGNQTTIGNQTTKINDGTNTAAVKAASTAATAADPSLVVAISQNTPITVTASIVPASATTGLTFGRVVGTSGVLSAIRATTYTEQTSNFTGSVKSSSASDASAGVGARQVTIYYVDSTGATAGTEVVTLNGTTAVNLVTTTKCFIEKMVVTSVGSTGSNVGTITLFTGSGGTGTTVGTIAVGTVVATVGDNQTFWTHHYVVSGKTASLATITFGTNGNQAGIAFLRERNPTVSTDPDTQISDTLVVAASSNGISRVQGIQTKVVGPARITMYLVPSGSNTNFFGAFDYSEVSS